jgi:hypothetical protein
LLWDALANVEMNRDNMVRAKHCLDRATMVQAEIARREAVGILAEVN